MERIRKQDDGSLAVYDGTRYLGSVVCHGASFAVHDTETTFLWFMNQGDAIGWLVAGHRGIPMAERPARQFTEE
jgi:hypothetical protein